MSERITIHTELVHNREFQGYGLLIGIPNLTFEEVERLVTSIQTTASTARLHTTQKRAPIPSVPHLDESIKLLIMQNSLDLRVNLHNLIFVEVPAPQQIQPPHAKRIVITDQMKIKYILQLVSEHYYIPPDTLLGKEARNKYAEARQLAMYLVRQNTDLSYPDIGKVFYNRDHTSIMHGVRQTEIRMKNENFNAVVNELQDSLQSLLREEERINAQH